MKHIDIQPLIEAVKNIEKQQVCASIGDGLGVTFNPDCPPAVEFYNGSGPASASVHSIRIEEGKPVITVYDDALDGGTYDIAAEDLYPGQLIGILSHV